MGGARTGVACGPESPDPALFCSAKARPLLAWSFSDRGCMLETAVEVGGALPPGGLGGAPGD